MRPAAGPGAAAGRRQPGGCALPPRPGKPRVGSGRHRHRHRYRHRHRHRHRHQEPVGEGLHKGRRQERVQVRLHGVAVVGGEERGQPLVRDCAGRGRPGGGHVGAGAARGATGGHGQGGGHCGGRAGTGTGRRAGAGALTVVDVVDEGVAVPDLLWRRGVEDVEALGVGLQLLGGRLAQVERLADLGQRGAPAQVREDEQVDLAAARVGAGHGVAPGGVQHADELHQRPVLVRQVADHHARLGGEAVVVGDEPRHGAQAAVVLDAGRAGEDGGQLQRCGRCSQRRGDQQQPRHGHDL